MNSILKVLGILVVGAVIGAVAVSSMGGSLGGVYTQVNSTFRQGIKVGTGDQFQVSSTGAVTSTASLTTTGNITAQGGTATSTLIAGCYQALATSSATKIKVIFSTSGATSTFNGTAYWSYGTCP